MERLGGEGITGKLILLPRTQRGKSPSPPQKEPSQENRVDSSAHGPTGINYTSCPASVFPFPSLKEKKKKRLRYTEGWEFLNTKDTKFNLEKAGSIHPTTCLKSIKAGYSFPVRIN